VIVACYRQPRELELVLAALAAQSDPAFDVVVADDGSQPPAERELERLRPALPFAVRWVWQEDRGFRKARALNAAAAESDAELLVFLDGDCLPFRDLLATYRARARPREFLAGAVGYLGERASRSLSPESVRAGAHERALPLLERLRLWRIHLRNLQAGGRRQTRPRIRGGNFAVDAALFREVDGFDEVYCGYGREDSDLRNRMRNAGARGVSLWHRAWAVHLARRLAPSGARRPVPEALYAEGRGRVRARLGLSGHRGAASAPR
jgi:GT2 family glycosyltransferase